MLARIDNRERWAIKGGEHRLGIEDLRCRGLQLVQVDPPLLDGRLDRLDRLDPQLYVVADTGKIHPRGDGSDAPLYGAKVAGDGVHLEAIGEDEALEAELLLQEAGDDGTAHRCRHRLLLEGGEEDVAAHHRLYPVSNRGLEGGEVLLEVGAVPRYRRQGDMAVEVGIAVAGEVLGRGHHAPLLQALDHLRCVGDDRLGPIAVGAYPDDRVVGVRVHIDRGGEVDGDPHCPQFGCGEEACTVCVLRRAAGGNRHRSGHVGAVGRETGDHPTLLVDADEGGSPARLLDERLDLRCQGGKLLLALDIVGEEDDVGYLVGADGLPEPVIDLRCWKSTDQVLADQLPHAHPLYVNSSTHIVSSPLQMCLNRGGQTEGSRRLAHRLS